MPIRGEKTVKQRMAEQLSLPTPWRSPTSGRLHTRLPTPEVAYKRLPPHPRLYLRLPTSGPCLHPSICPHKRLSPHPCPHLRSPTSGRLHTPLPTPEVEGLMDAVAR